MTISSEQLLEAVGARVHDFLVAHGSKTLELSELELLACQLNDYIKSTGADEHNKMTHRVVVVGSGSNLGLNLEAVSTVTDRLIETSHNDEMKSLAQSAYEAYIFDSSDNRPSWPHLHENIRKRWERMVNTVSNIALSRWRKLHNLEGISNA
jgi:hypothetical protein